MHLSFISNDLDSKSVVKVVCDRYDNVLYFSRNIIPCIFNKCIKNVDYYASTGIYLYERSKLDEYKYLKEIY